MIFPRKFVHGLILTIAVSLTLVLAVGIWKGRKLQEPPTVSNNDPSGAEMKLTDMEYTEMQEGRRVWTLKASEAKYFQEDQKTALTQVRLVFYLDDGDEIHLESQKGVLYAGTKDIELWESVRVELPRGYELSTDRAMYRYQERSISSETPIRLSGPDMDIRGNDWKFMIAERQALVHGAVRATIALLPPQTESAR